MDKLIEYFTDMFHLDKHTEPPLRVVEALNMLDRAERGELKARIFTEAKRLGTGGDGLKAIRWIETTFNIIEKYSFRLHEVLFSPGQDIPENIAFYMTQAKQSIDLCVYTISDEKLSKCILYMHEKGVKVRIITDNNKMRDVGSQVKELARHGVSVKIDNSRYHMHNKFGIIDGRIAFTGSYNWTYTAQAHNQENLVITTNFTIVHKFIQEFESLWNEMFWLRIRPIRNKDKNHKTIINESAPLDDYVPSDVNTAPSEDNNSTPAPAPGNTHREYWKKDKNSQNRSQNHGNNDFRGRNNKKIKSRKVRRQHEYMRQMGDDDVEEV